MHVCTPTTFLGHQIEFAHGCCNPCLQIAALLPTSKRQHQLLQGLTSPTRSNLLLMLLGCRNMMPNGAQHVRRKTWLDARGFWNVHRVARAPIALLMMQRVPTDSYIYSAHLSGSHPALRVTGRRSRKAAKDVILANEGVCVSSIFDPLCPSRDSQFGQQRLGPRR